MPRDDPNRQPFYLIVTDQNRGVFAVEGPMTDDRPWQSAAREARSHQRKIACAAAGPDRERWWPSIGGEHRLSGVPPGSIVRPRP